MTNDFTTRWDEIADQGHAAGRYRVRPDHLLDLFLGYSSSGEREFTLEVSTMEFEDVELPEFENMSVHRSEIRGGQSLTLRLTERSLKELFSVVCLDLAEASSRAETQAGAVRIFFGRLTRWADLLRWRRTRGMSFKERLGLLGELSMLIWVLDEAGVDRGVVIRGWRGPDGDTNDIGLNSVRIEVKAQLSTQSPTLKISSLSQLDWDGRELCVALHRFSAAENELSLRSLTAQIAARLSGSGDDLMEFQRKLLLAGYESEAVYVDEAFRLDVRTIYRVGERFPRLVPGSVPVGIRNARYEIAGEAIQDFEIGAELLEQLINA